MTATCDAATTPALSATTTAQNAVIHAIALSTGAAPGDARTADGDFDQGETFTTGFGGSHSGSIVYADDRGAVSAKFADDHLVINPVRPPARRRTASGRALRRR